LKEYWKNVYLHLAHPVYIFYFNIFNIIAIIGYIYRLFINARTWISFRLFQILSSGKIKICCSSACLYNDKLHQFLTLKILRMLNYTLIILMYLNIHTSQHANVWKLHNNMLLYNNNNNNKGRTK
jgi:hypothetical protein